MRLLNCRRRKSSAIGHRNMIVFIRSAVCAILLVGEKRYANILVSVHEKDDELAVFNDDWSVRINRDALAKKVLVAEKHTVVQKNPVAVL